MVFQDLSLLVDWNKQTKQTQLETPNAKRERSTMSKGAYKKMEDLPKRFKAAFEKAVDEEITGRGRCKTCQDMCHLVQSQKRQPGQTTLKTACRVGYNYESGGGCLINFVLKPSRIDIYQAMHSCLHSIKYIGTLVLFKLR